VVVGGAGAGGVKKI